MTDSSTMTTPENADLIAAMGPLPFRFTPQSEPMVSPSFSHTFKLLAIALLAGTAYWAYRLHGNVLTNSSFYWLWGAWGIMAYTVMHVLKGHTTLTAQTWSKPGSGTSVSICVNWPMPSSSGFRDWTASSRRVCMPEP
jgi:hypothetical protein